MLNPFPDVLILELFAPTLLRLAAGCAFLMLAYTHLVSGRADGMKLMKTEWGAAGAVSFNMLPVLEILAGLSLILGLLTQIGALIGISICILLATARGAKYKTIATESMSFYLLLGIVCFSLFITGAGLIAFDVPL